MTALRVFTDQTPAFDLVIADLKASTRKQVMQGIAAHVSEKISFLPNSVFDLLMDRERLATSGIGHGVSIPHLRLPDLPDRFYGLARLSQPVDFMAMDNMPVDLVAFVFSPVADGMKHLSRLSRLSRLMRDEALLQRIRNAETQDTMEAVLMAHQQAAHQQLLAA